jgi:hypothetical protein
MVEAEAAEFLAPVAECRVSQSAAAAIRARMMGALTATTRAGAPRSRWAAASLAVFAPLMAVSAVAAATGESPVSGPMDLVQSAAASVGIGGNSGPVRQDGDVRVEQSSDAGQPGSTPGNTANAPGLNQAGIAAATETPTPGGTPAAGATPDATATKMPPHENGKGCDDVLFANGEPPFASPGGPVGCDVGNSGDHRKNGAKSTPTPDASATPSAGETPAANEDVSDTSEDGNGGVSHGLGNGHSEDKPGNGQGNGHDKHEHDPNTNGNGPQNSGGDTSGSATPTPDPVAPTSSESGTNVPGNSGGKGNGKNK